MAAFDPRPPARSDQPRFPSSGTPLDAVRVTWEWLCAAPHPVTVDGRVIAGLPDQQLPLDELRARLLARGCPPAVRDAVWAHLVRRSRTEGGTWTVAAAGMALPVLTRVGRILTAKFAGDPSDIHAAVLAGFLTGLTRVDPDRPAVLVSLRWAAYRGGLAAVREALRAPVPVSGRGFESTPPRPVASHPDLVLARAVADKAITRDEATLIGSTRLEHVRLADAANARGQTYQAANAARYRAERRLLAYLTTRDTGLDTTPDTGPDAVPDPVLDTVLDNLRSQPHRAIRDRAVRDRAVRDRGARDAAAARGATRRSSTAAHGRGPGRGTGAPQEPSRDVLRTPSDPQTPVAATVGTRPTRRRRARNTTRRQSQTVTNPEHVPAAATVPGGSAGPRPSAPSSGHGENRTAAGSPPAPGPAPGASCPDAATGRNRGRGSGSGRGAAETTTPRHTPGRPGLLRSGDPLSGPDSGAGVPLRREAHRAALPATRHTATGQVSADRAAGTHTARDQADTSASGPHPTQHPDTHPTSTAAEAGGGPGAPRPTAQVRQDHHQRRRTGRRRATRPTTSTGGTSTSGTGVDAQRRGSGRREPSWRSGGRLAVVLAIASGLCIGVAPVSARAWAQDTGVVLAQAASIDQVLSNVRGWLMGILAGLATVMATVGGIRYVIADGDPGEIQRAKTAFRSAGIGFALAALAPLLVTILQGVVGL